MTQPLSPLGLDDIRAADPDRDNGEAFDARETWFLACDKLGDGYPAADVAAVLLTLAPAELDAVAADWQASTLETLNSPATEGRDFNCPDLRLCLALQEADPEREAWTCAPALDPGSLWETVRFFNERGDEIDRLLSERDRLRALLDELRALPGDDDGATIAVALSLDFIDRIDAAMAPRP